MRRKSQVGVSRISLGQIRDEVVEASVVSVANGANGF